MHRPLIALALGAALIAAIPHAASPQQLPSDTTSQRRPGSATDSVARRKPQAELDAPVYAIPSIEVIGRRNRGYAAARSTASTKTDTPLRDTPQSVGVITRDLVRDQSMQTMADVVRYVPGVGMAQGEGHRDAPTIRGNASTADFFVDGIRDDAQYFRDLYNVDRVEALKGSNGMVFGRGGGGGVINRVTKEAGWGASHTLTLEGGSFQHRRTTADLMQPFGRLALRLNAMLEESRSFRDEAAVHRRGVNPTLALRLGSATTLHAGYELFRDERTVDRGIPSFAGAPSPAAITTFFGNPDSSYARARVQTATALVEHAAGPIIIRNRARFSDYDKFYQNSYAGSAVNAAGTQVSLSAYNHATPRRNFIDQTDVIARVGGALRQTLLVGVELSRQRTDNVRRTGYYGGTATSLPVDFGHPTVTDAIAFRQSATDADNRTIATVAAAYVQDQLTLSERWQAVVGLRHDRFAVANHNRRTGEDLSRADRLLSPRAGLVYKPFDAASLYASYGVTYLPSTGDQFSSLTATTQTLEPERFTNQEVGGKWDVRPELSLTAALYRLDRTNTSAPDPQDPQRLVQTGSQRSMGAEVSLAGAVTDAWHMVAGAAVQRARIVSATTAAKAGARVPLVPARTLSLWNRYDLRPGLGAGLGVVRQSDVYAAIDNSVKLPAFTRVDGALFLRLSESLGAQVNVENVLNARYYPTSQGNNNILPGAPRTLRVALTAKR